MCHTTTYTCPICARTSTRPPTLCEAAEEWGCVCKAPHEQRTVRATCSDKCRGVEEEVRGKEELWRVLEEEGMNRN